MTSEETQTGDDSTYSYQGIKVQQKTGGNISSPPLYMTNVKAAELLKWADVPRKKADFLAGYQRDLNENRLDNIKEYLEKSDNNIIPGAILVAADSDSVEVSDRGETVEIEIKNEEKSTGKLIEQTYNEFYGRLGVDEKKFVDDGSDLEEDLDMDEEEGPPSSYLAEITAELKQANENINNLDDTRKEAIIDYVKGVSRPGKILDGQHRVFGAKEVADFDVQFPIVLMPGMDEAEQVYHFYVVNNKAKPLRPRELRATISTSLSNEEIKDLYQRFRTAGVRAEEAQLTWRMHTDEDSPFKGLVDFGFEESQGFLKENVAFQLVTKFVKMDVKYRDNRFSQLYADIAEWEEEGGEEGYDYRLSTFYAFWEGVKGTYNDTWENTVKSEGGQLFQKVALLKLQELVLERLRSTDRTYRDFDRDPLFKNHENLKDGVESVLDDLPERFFTEEWKESGLDTSDGREYFKEQMEKAMAGAQIGKLGLFRES
ncbi:ParB N-terminal domain-containing protein [Halorussus halophilus]|uniref:hypothetical protein n=1 Tax=Halorussus halophilus TaxID=2650975 RepID=UPI0013018413|nr:hypothetical protein [Halorussus halophilus]